MLLEVDRITVGYGRVEVVHGLELAVPKGAVVALLGANGAGKTTTLRALSGTMPIRSGAIRLNGHRIDGQPPYQVARRGVVLVPEGRGVFPALSVRDNLAIAARAVRGIDAGERSTRLDRVLATFPRLGERLDQRAGLMSGGEQQMLALSRALLVDPQVLLLDEISMGLAPLIVEELFEEIAKLREVGVTIVLVEQYLTYALRFADICYLLTKGRVAFVGEPAELAESGVLTSSYLGVG